MSGICGIVNFDGAPVDPELLEKMAQAAAYRGPDGIHYWIESNAGLAHLALHTTPESLDEKQPVVSQRGDLVLAADARVDNREELTRTLTAKGYSAENDSTDADLILSAYECWHEASPKEIVGDFAFIVWDQTQQKLFCARDTVGVRPLFYTRQGEAFYFASALSSILAALGERPPLNELFIVDFLCWKFHRWVNETIYQQIFRLPAAHTLEVNLDKAVLTDYWDFSAGWNSHFRSEGEYIERFSELFHQAICSRLRSLTDVGISVSGGLDSSSIACAVHHLSESSLYADKHIRLYSWAFEKYSKADEREYLRAVLDECIRFPATVLDGDALWGLKDFGVQGGFPLDEPEIFPIRSMLTELLIRAREDGCRVVLSGEGGDQLLSSTAYWHPEVLLELSLEGFTSEWKYFWKHNKWNTLNALVTALVRPHLISFIPPPLLFWLRSFRMVRSAPKWVRSEWIRLSHRYNPPPSGDPKVDPSNRLASLMYRQLTGGWYAALLNYISVVSAFEGVEYRFPYLDRRLIEFMLSMPPYLRFGDGLPKKILRSAMQGVLPETVRQRSRIVHFSQAVDFGLRTQERSRVQRFLNSGSIIDKYINQEKVALEWKEYYNGISLPQKHMYAPLHLGSWFDEFSLRGT